MQKILQKILLCPERDWGARGDFPLNYASLGKYKIKCGQGRLSLISIQCTVTLDLNSIHCDSSQRKFINY